MDKTCKKKETFVSVVLILENVSVDTFVKYLHDLQRYLDYLYCDYEIIIIDQNNHNFPESSQKNMLQIIQSIRWIKLAFPVEIDIALTAGIENAIGDFVVLLRPTIDPIEIIQDLVQENSKGYDIIIGLAKHPRTLGYRIFRKLGNKILQSINYQLPNNASPVRCLSRRAINTMLNTGQISHHFFIKTANTGYQIKNYEYQLLKSNNLTKRTLYTGIRQTMNLMIFNSTKPLRWISFLGICGSFFAFIFAMYSIIINLLKQDVIEGWTSMVFFSSFLFMILFIILAFLGEYMARLLNETGKQKKYYVSSEQTSSVMLAADRNNVTHQS